MLKTLLFLGVFFLFLASCGGYFDQNLAKTDRKIKPLMLWDGSGYLSTDEYNERTPFVFRDPDSGRAFLFFSSDRDGNYDIYYAEMFWDGTFDYPVKMSNAVNSTSNEISPIVFKGYMFAASPQTNFLISFIRISPTGNSTNIVTWKIDSNFNLTNVIAEDQFNFNAKHIGFINVDSDPIYSGELIICDSSSNGFLFQKGIDMNSTFFVWGGDFGTVSLTNVFRLSNKALAANGFFDQYYEAYFYIFQNAANQMWGGEIYNFDTTTNFFDIPLYASDFKDIDPFVDQGGPWWETYFASDRYGLGNYDLYRYNYFTYWVVAP